jgi:hypothetical protein
MTSPSEARLLPWSTPEGKACYLLGAGSGGPVSRFADDMERVQLAMAERLVGHAADLLGDEKTTDPQLRFLAGCLVEALSDVRRIAESRGARIPVAEGEDAEP